MNAPFAGQLVVELAGIGPGPFATMMLSDFGAEVVRIDQVSAVGNEHPLMGPAAADVMSRGRRSIAVDLKRPEGVEIALDLISRADVLIDPFRPGVTERLGLGPEPCLALRPELIYARITGWGQDGPRARHPGHDINYLARSGALEAIGFSEREPPPPLNLVADFGGGGMLAAFGIAAALFERRTSGRGQVIDAAMIDGVTTLMASIYGFTAADRWRPEREANLLDGGAPFYRCYRTNDHRYLAVGALEPQFYVALLEGVGLDPQDWPQHDRREWPRLAEKLGELFAAGDAAEWQRRFSDGLACVSVVASLEEAYWEPQLRQRESVLLDNGVRQPAPAPRLGRTPGRIGGAPPASGQDTRRVLAELGRDEAAVTELERRGAARQL